MRLRTLSAMRARRMRANPTETCAPLPCRPPRQLFGEGNDMLSKENLARSAIDIDPVRPVSTGVTADYKRARCARELPIVERDLCAARSIGARRGRAVDND